MDEQNRNLILATALSFLVILVWTVFFSPEPAPPTLEAVPEGSVAAPTGDGIASAPPAEGAPALGTETLGQTGASNRAEALGATRRIEIKTPRVIGSMSLIGGRIDDLSFVDYRETVDPTSPAVILLSPFGAPDAYYAIYGWAPAGGYEGDLPNAKTEWSVESGTILTPDTPVTLVWDNGSGLIFRRAVSIDDNYMFSVEQSVENTTSAPVRLAPYGIVARHGEPDTIGFYILHEGIVQASDGEIAETDYDDMPDFAVDPVERAAVQKTEVVENGWIGFTDKYWMTTLIPQPGQPFTAVAKYTAGAEVYQTDMRLPVQDVAPGATVGITSMLFAGAKEWEPIRDYQDEGGIVQFVDSIDWGWFFFLTKPMFQLLHFLNQVIGNMGWAIIGLTFVVKLVLFPLAYKSYSSMAKMKMLQPEMEKLKERAGDDRQALQKEMMALYKKEKVNPAAGCLPILVQIPIFFSLYKVIFVTLELRHAPFIGWIKDLSAPDPTSWLNLFGLLPYDVSWAPVIISIGVFPILMGVTMWLQQKLNPTPTDATQAMIFAWMPWVFMFMLGSFASGLVIYWVANNTLTFIQQYTIMRAQGAKPDIFGNIKSGFKRKKPDET